MNRKGFTKVLLLIVIVLAVVVLVLQTGPKASINIKIQEWGQALESWRHTPQQRIPINRRSARWKYVWPKGMYCLSFPKETTQASRDY